jgi:hypothetical protein
MQTLMPYQTPIVTIACSVLSGIGRDYNEDAHCNGKAASCMSVVTPPANRPAALYHCTAARKLICLRRAWSFGRAALSRPRPADPLRGWFNANSGRY